MILMIIHQEKYRHLYRFVSVSSGEGFFMIRYSHPDPGTFFIHFMTSALRSFLMLYVKRSRMLRAVKRYCTLSGGGKWEIRGLVRGYRKDDCFGGPMIRVNEGVKSLIPALEGLNGAEIMQSFIG